MFLINQKSKLHSYRAGKFNCREHCLWTILTRTLCIKRLIWLKMKTMLLHYIKPNSIEFRYSLKGNITNPIKIKFGIAHLFYDNEMLIKYNTVLILSFPYLQFCCIICGFLNVHCIRIIHIAVMLCYYCKYYQLVIPCRF